MKLPAWFHTHNPYTPSAVEPWRWLWPLLGLGWLLRVYLGINTNWYVRADELMQYLEQAHRVVFGYGVVPWEYRFGVRNWMISAPAIGALYLAKALGLGQPWYYIPIVKITYVTISMLLPLGMYHLVRRTNTEMAGRAALLFGLLWYEMLVFAHRPLSEALAAALLFAALGLGRTDIKPLRAGVIGCLFALAISMRIVYAPLIGIAGLVLLLMVVPRSKVTLLAGGIAGLLLWGLVDRLTWGGWWESIFNYLVAKRVADPYAAGTENTHLGFVIYLPQLIIASSGISLLALLLGFWRPRQHWFLLTILTILIVPHFVYSGAQYSNLFVAIPLLLCLTAGVWGWSLTEVVHPKSLPKLRQLAAGAIAIISLLGAVDRLPHYDQTIYKSEQLFFYEPPFDEVFEYLARLPDDELITLYLKCGSMLFQGGYYHLHQPVPVMEAEGAFAVGSRILNENDMLVPLKLDAYGNLAPYDGKDPGEPITEVASHVISCDNRHIAGFRSVLHTPLLQLLANKDMNRVKPQTPNFHFSFNIWYLLENILIDKNLLEVKEVYLDPPVN